MTSDNKKQVSLDLPNKTGTVDKVNSYKFEPIKGFPMLNWRGKRPFTSTEYFPAQLKEIHGEEIDGWRNKIFWGDNLQVMSHLLKEFRGKVDLIYIDPPFDSKADYKKKISLKGKELSSDQTSFEEKQYTDIWSNDDYLQFMYERLILLRELLRDSGSIYMQCDYHQNHYLRCVLDEVFGKENFLNEVIWKRAETVKGNSGQGSKYFGENTDTIFVYRRGGEHVFNSQFKPYTQEYVDAFYKNVEQDTGRKYQLISMTAPGGEGKGNPFYEVMGISRHWRYSKEKMQDLIDKGLVIQTKEGNVPRRKIYLDEGLGVTVELASCIDHMLRAGYISRNPFIADVQARLYQTAELLRIQKAHADPLEGMICLEGHSGMGKTRMIRTVLSRYPQAIRHNRYGDKSFNQIQIVWISVDAPIAGSMKGLLLRLLRAIDEAVGQAGSLESYEVLHMDSSVDTLIGVFAQSAATHRLGILHIDDIQRVEESASGRKYVIQTIIQIANVLKCPVIFSGTPKTMDLLGSTFELSRRTTKGGSFDLARPVSSEDAFFKRLFNEAMRFQWVDQPIAATPELRRQLYQLCAGVTAVFLLLHKGAQKHALLREHGELKLQHYAYVYRRRMKTMRRPLHELRKGGPNGAQAFEELVEELSAKGIPLYGGGE